MRLLLCGLTEQLSLGVQLTKAEIAAAYSINSITCNALQVPFLPLLQFCQVGMSLRGGTRTTAETCQ